MGQEKQKIKTSGEKKMTKETILKNQVVDVEVFVSDDTTDTKFKSFKRCVYVSPRNENVGKAKVPLFNFYIDVVHTYENVWECAIDQEDKDYRRHELYEKTCPTVEEKEACAVLLSTACWDPRNEELARAFDEYEDNPPVYPAIEEACVKGANHHKVPYVVARTISSGHICLMLNTAIDMQHKCDIIKTVFPSGSFDQYAQNIDEYLAPLEKDQEVMEQFNLSIRLLGGKNEDEEEVTPNVVNAFKAFYEEAHTTDRLGIQYGELFAPRVGVGYASQIAHEKMCSFVAMLSGIENMKTINELEKCLSDQMCEIFGYNPDGDWLLWATDIEVKNCLEQSVQLSIINIFDNFMDVRAGKRSYTYNFVEVENNELETTTIWCPNSLEATSKHI
jgi:hypothetical protein